MMDWELEDIVLFALGVLLIVMLACSSFGFYKLGRSIERKELEPFIVKAVGTTYSEGLSDGQALCMKSK